MLSVDALRDYLKSPIKTWDGKTICYTSGVDELLDAIEREVADMVPLPLDADGVPIHIGDVMETDSGIREVDVLQKSSRKWSIGLVPVGGGAFSWHDAETLHHHHAPTVEDVLREFGAGWYEQMDGPETFDIADYVERYAAKLRLAGEGE